MIFLNNYLTTSKMLCPDSYGIWYKLGTVRGVDISGANLALSYGLQYGSSGGVRPIVILDNNININYANGVWTVSAE